MINTESFAPVIGPTLAYDDVLKPTLRGLIIKSAGTLVVEDINGKEAVIPFAGLDPSATAEVEYSNFPFVLYLQIRKIVGDGAGSAGNGTTGTDITLANLVPLC